MKRTTLALITAIVVTAATALTMNAFFNSKPDSADGDGHVLTSLWSSYAKAEAADLPLKQLEILTDIKKEALKRRLAWDFYDAGRRYVNVSASRNWKLRDSLETRFAEEVRESGIPTAQFALMLDSRNFNPAEALTFLRDNAGVMKSSNNPGFYGLSFRNGNDRFIAREYRRTHYQNDWQFAMWTLLGTCDRGNVRASEIFAELSGYENGSYPFGALLEYAAIPSGYGCDKEKSRAELKAFAEKYRGRAVSAWAEAALMDMEFSDLEYDNAGSEAYRSLYDRCRSLLKEMKSYSGDEAEIVSELSSPSRLAETLSSRDISISVNDGKAEIVLKNLEKVKISLLKDGKSLSDTTLMNEKNSFYVGDTLTYTFPAMDDGPYEIRAESGNVKHHQNFEIHRISLALRREASGLCVYAADWKTGEPVGKADIRLYKNGNLLKEAKDFVFNGFTALPEDIGARISGRANYELECSCKDADGLMRTSRRVSYWNWRYDSSETMLEVCTGEIFTDKRAYRPGERVEFKAILFRTDYRSRASVLPEGKQVKVEMFDAENNLIDSQILTTNEFGSVAGGFDIPEGGRNGFFSIMAKSASGSVSASFRVDEFVLPTFDLTFDKADRIYLPGDNLDFSGKLISYSGHSLSGATITFRIDSGGEVLDEGRLEIGPDGSFSKEVKTNPNGSWRAYTLTLTVNDNTGETQEWSETRWVAGYFNLDVSLENGLRTDGNVIGTDRYTKLNLIDRDNAEVLFSINGTSEMTTPVNVAYRIENDEEKVVSSGNALTGKAISLDFSGLDSGLYRIIGEAAMESDSGEEYSDTVDLSLLLVRPEDNAIDAPVAGLIAVDNTDIGEGEDMALLIGNADGSPLWAFVDVFGEKGKRLDGKAVALDGVRAGAGSLARLSFGYKAEYPDAVRMQVFFFRDGKMKSFSHEFRRSVASRVLPLEWTSFEDRTEPASLTRISLKTSPGVEVLAAVFDKSSETIASNHWEEFSLDDFHIPELDIQSVCGCWGDSPMVFGYGRMMRTKSLGMMNVETGAMMMDAAAPMAVEEDAVEEAAEDAAATGSMPDVRVREDFSTTLAFLPFLRPDDEGNVSFEFKTSDKLSTFIVSLYAHDKDMRNRALRREMMVTIPLKLSLVQPEYLYAGDECGLSVALYSNLEMPVAGTLALTMTKDGKETIVRRPVNVPAGASVNEVFDIAPDNAGEIGLKAVFVSDCGKYSDGMAVNIPVLPAVETVKEAHSAVLLAGMDKDSLVSALRSAFVNMTSVGAAYKEISIIDMIKEAVPSRIEPLGKDVLSLTEALYVRRLAESLGIRAEREMQDNQLLDAILACRNADGGFSWFEGMHSSPVVTAVVLERFAKLRNAGNAVSDLRSTVMYLDSLQFTVDEVLPYWRGGIDDSQYMYVRSMWPEVEFKAPSLKNEDHKKRFKAFRDNVSDYLAPSKARGMNGYLFGKVRRLSTLMNLSASSEGIALARDWGMSLFAARKMRKSAGADVLSLLQYAVEHRDGGIYYPNLVMPFRGLLESEAYAHSMLCDLFTEYEALHPGSGTGRVADGIRIWLMLQKETQHWDTRPEFIDAVNSVMAGDDAVKSTSVLILEKAAEMPFRDVKAAGNGFSIERKFYREAVVARSGAATGSKDSNVVELKEIKEGDNVNVGEKIISVCTIHNDENRSFVRINVPRPAGFRPVNQLSGHCGISGRRLWFWPQGYCNVKTSATEYYYDSYPEENTEIREEYFVTRPGRFVCPTLEVESLYAPHYRANSAYAEMPEIVL
ncbi:MAG: MG2 domain-containing protein [Candidatus Cryptobacteroides sp.]